MLVGELLEIDAMDVHNRVAVLEHKLLALLYEQVQFERLNQFAVVYRPNRSI